jgi:predicted dehydrogenase
MTTPYRVGIIGCSAISIAVPQVSTGGGRWIMPHSHAGAYHAHPDTAVVAVSDINPDATRQYVESWGTAAEYTDANEMIARENLDLLSIATPDHLHRPFFVTAAEQGIKGIFCEKPISTSLEDADAMIDAARKTGVKVVINHTRRFDSWYRHARRLIDDGKIGKVSSISGTLGGARAMLFRNGTHLIDIMLSYIDAAPIWVQAAYSDADASYGAGYHGDGGRNPDSEPAGTAIVGFANGARVIYHGDKKMHGEFRITIFGSDGEITLGNQSAGMMVRAADGSLADRPFPISGEVRSGMLTAVHELVDLVRDDRDSLQNLIDARTTLQVLLAITESASHEGKRVAIGA